MPEKDQANKNRSSQYRGRADESPDTLAAQAATQIGQQPLPAVQPGPPALNSAENVDAPVDESIDGAEVKRVKDRFELLTRLGTGGMGTVYKARDLRKVEAQDREPWVAIKLLNEDFKEHPSALISLQREARKSQTLTHPNIVKVFDFDRDGDTVFMTMELLRGHDMQQHIDANPTGIGLQAVMGLSREMGDALIHAHQNGIVHADFTPRNVFLTSDGTAKVLDFGIAQAMASTEQRSEHSSDKSTEPDAAPEEQTVFDPISLGALTPGYASLERLNGESPVPADDVYGLGCLIYELLTGDRPYQNNTAREAAEHKVRPQKPAKLPAKQWRVLRKAIALSREQRYQDVETFIADFLPRGRPARSATLALAGSILVVAAVAAYQAYTVLQEKEAVGAEQAAALEALGEEQTLARQAIDQDLQRINSEYMDWAQTLISNHQYDEAQQFLDRVQGQAEDDLRLGELQALLATAQADYQQGLREAETTRLEVARLINAAGADIKAGRLLNPAGNNAYRRYQQITALDPENTEAETLLQQIIRLQTQRVNETLRSGELKIAQNNLAGLTRLAPEHPSLPSLRVEVARAREQARNNASGIARLLEQARSETLSNDPQRREALYLEALAIDPENTSAAQGLKAVQADLLRAQRRDEQRAEARAQTLLTSALQLLEEQPPVAANFQRAYGALLDAQRASPGSAQVELMIDQMPQRYLLAIQGQMAAQQYVEADTMLQAALLLTPESRQLGQIQERLVKLMQDDEPPILPTSF